MLVKQPLEEAIPMAPKVMRDIPTERVASCEAVKVEVKFADLVALLKKMEGVTEEQKAKLDSYLAKCACRGD